MNYTGTINITDELTLKDPVLTIKKVEYDWANDSVDIEIIFSEGVYNHSRRFSYDTTPFEGSLTTADILSLINNDPVLGQFE